MYLIFANKKKIIFVIFAWNPFITINTKYFM